MPEGEDPKPDDNDNPAENSEQPETTTQPSNSEEPDFHPIPYVFMLKDVYGRHVYLPPDKLSRIRVSCPPLYKLVDHTIAVLWNFYRNTEESHGKLGSAQIEWALRFLEGIKSRYNERSPDVDQYIEDLSDTLVEIADSIDCKDISKRMEISNEEVDGIVLIESDYDDPDVTEQDMKDKQRRRAYTEEHFNSEFLNNTFLNLPERDKDTILDGIENGDDGGDNSQEKGTTDPGLSTTEPLLAWRKDKIKQVLQQLEDVSCADKIISLLNKAKTPEEIQKLKQMAQEKLKLN